MPTPREPDTSLSSMTTSDSVWSNSWPAASARKPMRVTRMLLRNPDTRQLRTTSPDIDVSAGVATSMPREPVPPPASTSAPWQSSTTSDAVMRMPPV